jgi:hypothetical protein
VQIRLLPGEKEAFRQRAEQKGKSVSEWARGLMRADAGLET